MTAASPFARGLGACNTGAGCPVACRRISAWPGAACAGPATMHQRHSRTRDSCRTLRGPRCWHASAMRHGLPFGVRELHACLGNRAGPTATPRRDRSLLAPKTKRWPVTPFSMPSPDPSPERAWTRRAEFLQLNLGVSLRGISRTRTGANRDRTSAADHYDICLRPTQFPTDYPSARHTLTAVRISQHRLKSLFTPCDRA